MVSFVQSNVAVAAALLASLATSEAAYGNLFVRTRPSTSLGYRMVPATRNRSLFTRDIDAMFEEMEEMLYEPFPLQRMSRPSYLLKGIPALNALVQGQAQESKPVAKNSYGITQDDKQLQIVLDVPGAKASDINLALEDGVLTISGELKRENDGISVHSRFERSITLPQDVDTNEIAARMNDCVLTITAPKVVEQKDTVRRIDIVEDKKAESMEAADKEDQPNAALHNENDEDHEKKPEVVDETVIDLDVKKE